MTELGPEIVALEIGDEILAPSRRRSTRIPPHRIALGLVGAALVLGAALFLRWDWLPLYFGRIVSGIGETVLLLVVTTLLGFVLAVPIGLAQVIGSAPLSMAARTFCTVIRGTPLLLQLWLLYYGLGSVFPMVPGIRDTVFWPYLRQAWPYAVVSLTLSFAGYEGEVMRGAFAGTPRGEIEAARAFGMSPFTLAAPRLAAARLLSRPADAGGRDGAAVEVDAPRRHHHGRGCLLRSSPESGRTPTSPMNRCCSSP